MLYIIVNVNKNYDKNFVDYIFWMKMKIEIYNIMLFLTRSKDTDQKKPWLESKSAQHQVGQMTRIYLLLTSLFVHIMMLHIRTIEWSSMD